MLSSLKASAQIVFLASFSCLVAGCATPGTSEFQYRAPSGPGSVTNETIVKLPFSDTWDLLIGQLAKGFFVINNVEKVSRIINVSFSTDKPEEYVECGTSVRSFKYADESQTFTYPTASSSSYKTTGSWGPYNNLPVVAYIERKTSLEGRINIYVAPKDNDTIVTVNSRYIVSSNSSGQQELINGAGTVVQRLPLPNKANSLSFNTGQVGSADWGGPDKANLVKCYSTGKLESEILEMIRR